MKYKNKKICVNGIKFDSKKESGRYLQLKAMEQAGEIAGLRRQVKFELIPTQRATSTDVYKAGPQKGLPKPGAVLERPVYYIADFTYFRDGKQVVEDVKGYRNPQSAGYAKFVIKRKLMLYRYGIEIREV